MRVRELMPAASGTVLLHIHDGIALDYTGLTSIDAVGLIVNGSRSVALSGLRFLPDAYQGFTPLAITDDPFGAAMQEPD